VTTRTQSVWPTGANYHGIEEVDAVEILDDSQDEIWNVQLSDGEVRSVSLDKLNDLYRFSLIDDNAFVWQPGMQNWTRLATLLGVDEPKSDDPYFVSIGPGNVKQVTLEQLDDFYRYGVVEEGTLIWQNGMPEWRRLGSLAGIDTQASQQGTVAPVPATALAVAAAPRETARAAFVVPSAPPLALSIESSERRPSAVGRWLIRLATLAGVVIVLFRNDLVFSVASRSPFAGDYAKLERSLFGGPVFGTERSVERFVAAWGGHLEPVRLPVAVGDYTSQQKRASSQSKSPESIAAPNPGARHTQEVPAPAPNAAPTVAVVSNPKPPANSSVTPTNGNSVARTPKPRASTSKATLRKNGNYFDPLNPSL
jgi:hypothetical protein